MKSDGNSLHGLKARWAKNETNINETIFLTWDNNPQNASGDGRFLEKGFGINQIYFFFSMNLRNLHNTQEAGKWWAFWYEILIIIFFHSQIFP
jgi:hypothetical protein